MVRLFLVGGAVRDYKLGFKPKDLDYVIEGLTYDEAREYIVHNLGCTIFQERSEYNVFRTVHPQLGGLDFALPRADFDTNGRQAQTRPVATIEEDLARRDFTINAIAWEVDSQLTRMDTIIDPFSGIQDIQDKIIRFVGSPQDRIQEDNLRVLRALRFAITKGFTIEPESFTAICNTTVSDVVSKERIFEELNKMFAVSPQQTVLLLISANQLYLLDKVKIKAST